MSWEVVRSEVLSTYLAYIHVAAYSFMLAWQPNFVVPGICGVGAHPCISLPLLAV